MFGKHKDSSLLAHSIELSSENLLAPLFATRKATVTADMGLEDRRTGQIGHSSGAQGAFARSMGKRSSRWSRKIEVATREYEYAIQRGQKEGANAVTICP